MADGSLDFSLGVNSVKVPTIQSSQNPNGLARNELAWLINADLRDGGITQRAGWRDLGRVADGSALYQGGFMYDPLGDFPYIVASIGGHILKIVPDNAPNPVDLSTQLITPQPTATFLMVNMTAGINFPAGTVFHSAAGNVTTAQQWTSTANGTTVTLNITSFWTGPVPEIFANGAMKLVGASSPAGINPGTAFINPATEPKAYFEQAEQFLIIQAGDGISLPLFWNGSQLRRSKGITNRAIASGTPGVNEIPAATAMDYYMGRLWYAQGRQYSAGDIVGGASGTAAYSQRDSVLNVTENPLVLQGDGFTVPAGSGTIRALKHNASIDAALGQGRLFVFTEKIVAALQVPVTRTDWIGADNNNQPLQTIVQRDNGSVNDWGVVSVNGDLYYQSLEPQIRSLITAIRYFSQPGNIPISANENRVLQFNDRSLLRWCSGVYFNNRMLQTALPKQTPQGVVHQALIPLDFVPISSFNAQIPPIWQGIYQGLNVLQVFVGNFGGLERCFALVVADDSSIHLWEFSVADRFEADDKRVQWVIETPAYTWGQEFALKKLVSTELWVDRLFGTVDFQVEWRPDGDPCWKLWARWPQCSSRNSCEDVFDPICYPLVPFSESFRSTMSLPRPPESCESITGRPANLGYQFQLRITIKGFCRVRGFLLHAEPVERRLYDKLIC